MNISIKKFVMYSKLRWCVFLGVFLFLLSPPNLNATEVKSLPDSIFNSIYKEKGIAKIKLLDVYASHFFSNPQLIEELEKDAEKEGSHLYNAYILRLKLYHQAKEDDLKSIKTSIRAIDSELQLFDQTGIEKSEEELKRYNSMKSTTFNLKNEIYLHEGKYDLALIEVKNMMEKAKLRLDTDVFFERQGYTLLGNTYLHAKKWEEALKSFKSAFKVNEDLLKNSNLKLKEYSYYPSMEGMMYSYDKLEKYTQVLCLGDSTIRRIENDYQAIEKPNVEEIFIYNFCKSRILSLTALSYIRLDKTSKAREQLDVVKNFLQTSLDVSHSNFILYYKAEARYYLSIKNYAKAKKYVYQFLDNISINTHSLDYIDFNLLLAEILNAEGDRKNEVYDLMREVYETNDSINRTNFSAQVADIQVLHEVDKAKMRANQNEEKLKKTRIILIISLLSFVLTLLIAYLLWRNGRTLKEKNRQLFHQYTNRYEKSKLMHRFHSESIDESTELDSNDILIHKLEEYLLKSHIYRNAELSREELSLKIGTNRQYLIEAIKEKTGKNFNEYIYSFRLQDAYEKIVRNKEKAISDIFIEAGFSTRVTFNKAFKEAYGMTPSELRSVANEK